MSDQPPPDRASSDPSKQDAWQSLSESELDAALAEAASLAADLSEQLQSDPEPTRSTVVPLGASPDDPQRDIDTELQQLERLVGAAAADVQSADGASPASPAPGPTDSVPDFMAELAARPATAVRTASTIPPSTSPGSPDDLMADLVNERQDRERATAAAAEPGIRGSGTRAVVGAAVKAPPPDVPDPMKASPSEFQPGQALPAKPSFSDRWATPILPLLDRFVAALELMDRPLAGINSGVRSIVGWIAIAMILASIVILVRSAG